MRGQGREPWRTPGVLWSRAKKTIGMFPSTEQAARPQTGCSWWAPLTLPLYRWETQAQRAPLELHADTASWLPPRPGPAGHPTPRRPGSLETLWSQEVEEVEQLLQVVLKGGPRQQQLVINLVAVQDPKELREGDGAIRGSVAGPPRVARGPGQRRLPWTDCS